METILLKLIEQLNGAVFTLLGILIVAFFSIYKIGGIVKTFGDFKDKNKEFDGNIASIKDDIATIKATTNLLYQAYLPTVQKKSPLSLTETGNSYTNDLKIEDKVALHWEEIKKEIEKKNPINPYDVQMVSMNLATDFFNKILTQDEQDEFKLFAYKKGINLLEIYPIIGILARDKYLREKGLSVDEIDMHDPSKKSPQ